MLGVVDDAILADKKKRHSLQINTHTQTYKHTHTHTNLINETKILGRCIWRGGRIAEGPEKLQEPIRRFVNVDISAPNPECHCIRSSTNQHEQKEVELVQC